MDNSSRISAWPPLPRDVESHSTGENTTRLFDAIDDALPENPTKLSAEEIFLEFILTSTSKFKKDFIPLTHGTTLQVKISGLSHLTYPIDILHFQTRDEAQLEKHVQANRILQNVYFKLRQYTINNPSNAMALVLPTQDIQAGNFAVVEDRGIFKRVVIKSNIIKNSAIQCYLVDEGLQFMTRPKNIFITNSRFWNHPPLALKFRMNEFFAYRNNTQFRNLLKTELDPSNYQITAEIVTQQGYYYDVMLYSSKYGGRKNSLNQILLEKIRFLTEQQSRAPLQLQLKTFSSFAPIQIFGANWGRMNGPFVEFGNGVTLNITILDSPGPGILYVMPKYATETALIRKIHLDCQKFLSKYSISGEEKVCDCLKDGFEFVVEKEFQCTYLYRVKLIDRKIFKQKESPRQTKVKCLFVDRGEIATVNVEELRRMNPDVALIPSQGAFLTWICDDYKWDKHSWKNCLGYIKGLDLQAKVLSHQYNSSRLELQVHLYTSNNKESSLKRLEPKDWFWESPRRQSRGRFPSRR